MICYRREDTMAYAGRIYDRLSGQFGADSVYMDVDSIGPGQDFRRAIQSFIERSDVLVVVVGTKLAGAAESGRNRLGNPEDFVRIEIESALGRSMPIIPVLVGGARMPGSTTLPGSIVDFAYKNALELSDAAFHLGLSKLISAIKNSHQETGGPTSSHAQRIVLQSMFKDVLNLVHTGKYNRWAVIAALIATVLTVVIAVYSDTFFNSSPAVRALEAQARNGNVAAARRIGELYYSSFRDSSFSESTLKQDYSRAILWFKQAFDMGDIEAGARIGDAYDYSDPTVARDEGLSTGMVRTGRG